MNEHIDAVLKMVSGKEAQQFQGMKVAKKALQSMKEKNMKFTSAYLYKVDKEENVGTIKVAYVYSPYKDDLDGGWVVSPRMTGGIKVKVNLPFNSTTLQNKLHSPRCCGYWKKWIDRIALWTPPVSNIAAIAMDRDIYETNSPSEGQINSDKTHTSDHKETYSSVPAFIEGKWKNCKESERMFVHQVGELNTKIDKRKEATENKNKKKNKKRKIEEVEEEISDDEAQMVWAKTEKSVAGKLRQYKSTMIDVLSSLRSANPGAIEYQFKEADASSMYKAIEHYRKVNEVRSIFMGKTKFIGWVKGHRTKHLKKDDYKFVEVMYRDVIVKRAKQQEFGKGTV